MKRVKKNFFFHTELFGGFFIEDNALKIEIKRIIITLIGMGAKINNRIKTTDKTTDKTM
jgi:hypothetical protein